MDNYLDYYNLVILELPKNKSFEDEVYLYKDLIKLIKTSLIEIV